MITLIPAKKGFWVNHINYHKWKICLITYRATNLSSRIMPSLKMMTNDDIEYDDRAFGKRCICWSAFNGDISVAHTRDAEPQFFIHQVDDFLSHVHQDVAFAFLALVHFHLWHIFHFLLCSDDTPVVKVSLLKMKLHKMSSDVACGSKWMEETYYCTSILSEFCNDVKKPKERLQAMPLKYHTHTFLFAVGWWTNNRNHSEGL